MSTFQIIEIGKEPGAPFNVIHLLPLPSDSPFGNLALKYMAVLKRLDHANNTIQRIYAQHESVRSIPDSPYISSHLFLQEEVIYWLRQSTDELISLASVLEEWQIKGACPHSVPADCIGTLLNTGRSVAYSQSLDFLNSLNEVSNAYKHSFINTQVNLIGADEPVVFALALKRNKISNDPVFHQLTLASLVNGFNTFFATITQELRACRIPHIGPPQP